MENSLEYIQSLIDSDQLEDAENKARELFEKDKSSFDAQLTLARVLIIIKKYDEAQSLVENIIERDSKNHYPLYLLGFIKENQKEYDEAINLYKKALELKPNSGYINYRIGKIYNNYNYKGKNEYSALYHLRNSLTGDNPPVDAYIELASLEPLSRSIYILQKGVEKFPSDEDIATILCIRLFNSGEYLDCLKNVDAAIERDIHSSELKCLKMLSQYKIGQYEQAVTQLEQVKDTELAQNFHFQAFQGILLIEDRKFSDAEVMLKNAIANDIKDSLNFFGHIILACCYLRQSKYDEANKAFKEIPLDTRFEYPLYLFVTYSVAIELDEYFIEAVNGLVSNKTADANKAKYLKAIYDYSSQENKEKLSPERLSEIIKELVDSIPLLGRNPSQAYYYLYQISMELKDWLGAVNYYFLTQMHEEDDEVYTEIDSVLEQICKNQKSLEKLFSIIEKVVGEVGYLQTRFSKKCLSQLIRFFHSKKNFDLVVRLAKMFSFTNIFSAEGVFEVAYAYNEIGDKKQAKNYYRAYLKSVGENSAVMNNLALLEEGDGNLAEAERLFQSAINLDSNDDTAKSNHKRVIAKLQKEEGQRNAFQKAADLYMQETESARLLATKLYSLRASDGVIFCNENKMSSVTGLEIEEVEIRIDEFVKKKYFETISNESVSFEGRLLRTNPVVEPLLEEDLMRFQEKDALAAVASNLLSQNLQDRYGYGKELLEKLSIIKTPQLSKMLERDLYETVVSLAIKSYKSTLILCGSVVEAVLLDQLAVREADALSALERLLTKEGKALKGDDKNLQRWVLDRLLDVALELKIISENLYHWGHGLRGFRNLVHPGVEQRQTMEVSRENAEMAWNVVKRLFSEIKSKDKA